MTAPATPGTLMETTLMSDTCANDRYSVQLVQRDTHFLLRVRDLESVEDDNVVRSNSPHNEPQGLAWWFQLQRCADPVTEKLW